MYVLRFCFKILREQVDCGWLLIILDQNLYIINIQKKSTGILWWIPMEIETESRALRKREARATLLEDNKPSLSLSLSLPRNVYRISTHLYVTFVIISVNRSWDPKILILSWQWISLQWSSTWSTQSRAPTEICRPCHIKAAWLPPNCTLHNTEKLTISSSPRILEATAKTSIMTSCVQQSATVVQ